MAENNRPHRRIKTRPPYDLRRKVLLKNFLREQMSPTPLQATIESLLEHVSETSENEIVDVENYESTSDAMNLDSSNNETNPLKRTEVSSSEMEIDDENSSETEANHSSSIKSPLKFDFTKITRIKLSRFNSLKRKSPSLSAEAVKVIADKNSVHLESKEKLNKNVKAEVPVKESKFKYNTDISPGKRKSTTECGKKRGIIKAKDMVQSSKFQFKRQQVDKGKSSKLSKVRKMIVAVHHAIKGESSKIKNVSAVENNLGCTDQALPQHLASCDLIRTSGRFSKFGSFNNGMLIDFENEENDANIPERVRMIKAIKKRQYCSKYNIPNEEFHSGSVLENTNDFVCKLLRRKTFNRNAGLNSQEQARSWVHNSDKSWSLNEIRKLEKANECLREENKLLSDSLSSIMICQTFGTPRKQSAYNSCQSNMNDSFGRKQEADRYYADVDTPRFRVLLRSRSVQDRAERRREIRLRLSSRSMCHQQYSRIPPRTLYRAEPCIINPNPPDEISLPYPELPSISSANSDCNRAMAIYRRFSMLDSISRQPHVNRRSSCSYVVRGKPCIINPNPPDEISLPYPELPSILSANSDCNCAMAINRRFSMLESISRQPHVNRRSSCSYVV